MTKQEAIEWFEEDLKYGKRCDGGLQCNAYKIAISALRQSSADTDAARGTWKYDAAASEHRIEKIYMCSACEEFEIWGEAERKTYNFCPNCGARMEESE